MRYSLQVSCRLHQTHQKCAQVKFLKKSYLSFTCIFVELVSGNIFNFVSKRTTGRIKCFFVSSKKVVNDIKNIIIFFTSCIEDFQEEKLKSFGGKKYFLVKLNKNTVHPHFSFLFKIRGLIRIRMY